MKTRILIVDDEADIAETLQMFLEYYGYTIVVAFDGEDALHKAAEDTPDLIVTDMMMPRMDGPELIERIRATPSLRGVPVITMSANAHHGELPFFRKPFDPNVLLTEIRRLLR